MSKRSRKRNYPILLEQDGWYDFWHIHLDMDGEGNRSPAKRHNELAQHLALFQNFREQARTFSKPWQCWLLIDPSDSGQDAVYFHTPNPNENNFPWAPNSVVWGGEVPELLKKLINAEDYIIGHFTSEEGEHYYIKSADDEWAWHPWELARPDSPTS